ncbi:MAG: hypothetical protein Q7T71_08830 [Herbiconiux sp.]|nr:hypothetical protein [Herbiconiux sp.]
MHGPGPFPMIFSTLWGVLSLFAGFVGLVVLVGVLFLLVRFLWFGTRAAQLYLVRNGESPRFSWPPRPFSADPAPGDPAAGGHPAPPSAPRKPKSPAGP